MDELIEPSPQPSWEMQKTLKKAKTSLRIHYEAEAEVIRRKLGTLEAMRGQLGLSQRRICQLLLVDPSAWTRWTKSGEDAPPHIYRMLQWYLALQDKYPVLDVGFWLSTTPRLEDKARESGNAREIQNLQQSLHEKIGELSREIVDLNVNAARHQTLIQRLFIVAASLSAVVIALLFSRLF